MSKRKPMAATTQMVHLTLVEITRGAGITRQTSMAMGRHISDMMSGKESFMRPAFLFVAFSVATLPAATVQLDSGMISGVSGASAEVQVYKGIPYAAPP